MVSAVLATAMALALGAVAGAPAAALATVGPLAVTPQVAGWTTPVMVWDGNYSEPSVAVDAHGKVHIVARGDTGIWYLTNKSGHWTRTRLTTDYTSGQYTFVGEQPQIAIDPWDGSLTMVYLRSDNDMPSSSDVRYVTNRSGAWSAPRSIPSPHDGDMRSDPSLVVRHGVIAVATTLGGWDFYTTVEFLTNASGHWTSALVGPERTSGPFEPSLALDSHGRPVIAYVTGFGASPPVTKLHLARGATKTGRFTTSTVAASNSRSPSLALDAHDQPRLAWRADDGIHYAYRSASGWHVATVMGFGADVQLRLDPSGHPRILIAAFDAGLWYATKTSSGWHSVRLDPREIHSGSMAIGAGGRVSVGYPCPKSSVDANPRVWFTHTN